MKTEYNKEKYLESILAIALGFIFIALRFHLQFFLPIGFSIGLIGLFYKRGAIAIHYAWTKLSEGLGWFSSKVLLTIVFFLFLVPIALLSKLFNRKDSMHLQKPNTPSYYITRNHTYTSTDMQKPW